MFFTEEKLRKYVKELHKFIYQESLNLEKFRYLKTTGSSSEEAPIYAMPSFDDSNWEELPIGSMWGGRDQAIWLRASVEIPENWRAHKVALNINLGQRAEGLVFLNGQPVQGVDWRHFEVLIPANLKEQGRLDIAIRAWSGMASSLRQLTHAELVLINEDAEDLYFRASTMWDAINVLDSNDYNRQLLTRILDEAVNMLDFRNPGSPMFYETVTKVNIWLKDELKKHAPQDGGRPLITAIGHSHIDVAWLWRLCHTREKSARTFSTVLQLMDQYDDYLFLQSQPQLYEYIKEDYPEVYSKIKEKVKEGKWEVTGGMWVEADCNVPSGESLVRQFLFGTRFMEEEFGVECKTLWLPDVFGYSWALPQIVTKSGLKYFMTTKISWSQYNRPTYDTFMWRGIDGTELLSHFITTTDDDEPRFYTYNGNLNVASAILSWRHYQQKDINDELLISFGWGDGGGGPTKEMLQAGLKMQEIPGIPQIQFGKAEDFFERLEERVSGHPKLPVVDGELYLEYHRGTYTSQGKTKWNNRKTEVLLHDLEVLSSLGSNLEVVKYPQDKINEYWKVLLRNQFHDILPGSSIHEVYIDSEQEMGEVLQQGTELYGESLTTLANNVSGDGLRAVVFNTLPWKRNGEVELVLTDELQSKQFVSSTGEVLPSHKIFKDGQEYIRVLVQDIPAMGYATILIKDSQDVEASQNREDIVSATLNQVENRYLRIQLNDKGQIVSLFDKEFQRELVPSGETINTLQAFEDRPMAHNAWDIDIYYADKLYVVDELLESNVEESGGNRAVLRFKWKFSNSIIEQRMVVNADSRRIDFVTDVDWHEHQVLLKAAFPVDLRATKATYEIQFGNVERPTHWNTSWDYARFESVAQRWIDLSERDYGVSLLNDCKYGHDVKDSRMRITLIKSGVDPDPQADQGHHAFTYSLYPHGGDWFDGDTNRVAMELNHPLHGCVVDSTAGNLPQEFSFIDVETTSVILDTVKQSEDGENLVLRFYEYGNRRDHVTVNMAQEIGELFECNLMEKDHQPAPFEGRSFSFTMKPYEIKTFMLKLNR